MMAKSATRTLGVADQGRENTGAGQPPTRSDAGAAVRAELGAGRNPGLALGAHVLSGEGRSALRAELASGRRCSAGRALRGRLDPGVEAAGLVGGKSLLPDLKLSRLRL